MNVAAQPKKKLDWVKIGFIALLLAIAGYKYYSDNIAAPAVAENEGQNEKEFSDEDYKVDFKGGKSKGNDKSGYKVNFDPIKKPNGSKAGNASGKGSSNASFLVSAGGKNLKSPAGLIYGMGGGGEHRTDHVLRHAKDDTGRPSHGVFHAQGDDVFRLVDEAYGHVKSKSKQLKKAEESRGNMAYVIDMKRKIGYKGGQSGKRARNPALYKVKLIIADKNRVITAYPY